MLFFPKYGTSGVCAATGTARRAATIATAATKASDGVAGSGLRGCIGSTSEEAWLGIGDGAQIRRILRRRRGPCKRCARVSRIKTPAIASGLWSGHNRLSSTILPGDTFLLHVYCCKE